jgi:hypothetical protein
MDSKNLFSFDFFPTFQNKEEYYQRLLDDKEPTKKIIGSYFLILLFSFFYGIVMGSYHSFYQAFSSGIKVPVLFSLVLIICFPAFFIIQYILGSKLKLKHMVSIIFSGFVLTTAIMISFIPIIIFFLLTGSNYYFLQLLHIGIFILSGVFGMKSIIDALRYSCEKQNMYPKIGVEIFRFWVIILAFVGIQMAWNLRPFLGSRNEPFKFFREYEGNFYAALVYSVNQLMSGNSETDVKQPEPEFYYNSEYDSSKKSWWED